MDELAAALRRDTAIRALLPLFFVSGATALIYQTLWGRQLHLVFGTSTFAIATVLSAFMAGLALGGFAMGWWADRIPRPLRSYGILEIGIGLYGLIFPWLLSLTEPVYLALYPVLHPTPALYGTIQFLLVGSLLLVPTAFMGATLPILARFATLRLGAAGDRVGTLYAVNTAGAVFGTWFAGFVLLPSIGLWATTVTAAVANLALGAGAWALDEWARGAERAEVVDDLFHAAPFHAMLLPVCVAMSLAGFASLVYEVAWFRLLALMLGASVYAFSTMLLAFLSGIAIGGKLGGPFADTVMKKFGQTGVLFALAGIEVGVAVLSFLLMYVYGELPFWYVYLFDFLGAEDNETMMWLVSLLIAGLVMTPPAILMGAAFPVAVRAVLGDTEDLGGPVGYVYGANTLGGVLGAALAGFFLLPSFHVQGTILVAAAGNLVAAGVLVLVSRTEARWKWLAPGVVVGLALAAVATRPPWDPMLMTAGMYKYVSMFNNHSRQGILDYSVNKYELLYYAEGLSSVVTVARNRDSQNLWLANNGKVDASTTTDMPTQVLCSVLPAMHAKSRENVLVIGLASGVTAGALTPFDDLGRMEVVELEPAIVNAARFFDEYNNNVLDDPRVTLFSNDGRNHVLLAAPHSYDLIVSEPSNPWITGVSNLFTKEFFELGKSRLKPGGVWGQWVQMYGMGRQDLQSLLRTFAETYEHVAFYSTIEDADIVLVGSDQPLVLSGDTVLDYMMGHPKLEAQLEAVDIDDPLEIIALWQMDRDQMLVLADGAPLNTDDNMRIEYSAPGNLHASTQTYNLKLLRDHRQLPEGLVRDDPLDWADLARIYRDHGDSVRALKALVRATRLSEHDPGLRDELKAEGTLWLQEWLAEEEEDEEQAVIEEVRLPEMVLDPPEPAPSEL